MDILKREGPSLRLALAAGLTCLAAFVVFDLLYGEAEDRETRDVVMFRDREMTQPALAVPPSHVRSDDDGGEWIGVRAKAGGYSPIIRWVRRRSITRADGARLYYAPELLYSVRTRTPRAVGSASKWLAGGIAALLVVVAFWLVHGGRTLVRIAAGWVTLRAASLFWIFSFFGYFSIHTIDETHYLNIARKLLDWPLQFGEYPYTLGLPLLYTPLALAWPEAAPFAFAAVFSVLSFIIFGCGTLVLLLVVLDRAGLSRRVVMACGAAAALYPMIASAFHGTVEGVGTNSMFLGQWLANPPDTNYMSFFNAADLIGYNALSDMPALFFGLLGLALLTRGAQQRKSLAWAGMALGFSCLIRVAGIFYLLPAGLILLRQRSNLGRRGVAEFAAGMAAMVAVQMVWNWAVFGNPLTLGYKFRPEDYKGFQYQHVGSGIDIIGSLHFQPLAWAGLALLCLRRRRRFVAALLGLLILPTLVLYAGYHAVGTSPMRFLILPVFGMLVAVGFHLGSCERRRDLIFAVVAVFSPLVVLPEIPAGAFLVSLPGWVAPVLFLALAAVSAAYVRDWPYVAYFLVLASGRDWAVFGFLAAACLWVIAREMLGTGRPRQRLEEQRPSSSLTATDRI